MTTRRHRCGKCGRNLPVDHQRPYYCSLACRDYVRERNRKTAQQAYAADPKKYREISRRRREQDPAKANAAQKRWRAANPSVVREYQRTWAAANKEKRRDGWRRWVAAHPEMNRAKVRAWALANPDHDKALHRAKRARKRGAQGSHTAAEWRACLERFGRCCFYCGAPGRLTEDHLIALSRGGSDSIDNIVPACRRCNSSKKASDVHEWLARMQRGGMALTVHVCALLATAS